MAAAPRPDHATTRTLRAAIAPEYIAIWPHEEACGNRLSVVLTATPSTEHMELILAALATVPSPDSDQNLKRITFELGHSAEARVHAAMLSILAAPAAASVTELCFNYLEPEPEYCGIDMTNIFLGIATNVQLCGRLRYLRISSNGYFGYGFAGSNALAVVITAAPNLRKLVIRAARPEETPIPEGAITRASSCYDDGRLKRSDVVDREEYVFQTDYKARCDVLMAGIIAALIASDAPLMTLDLTGSQCIAAASATRLVELINSKPSLSTLILNGAFVQETPCKPWLETAGGILFACIATNTSLRKLAVHTMPTFSTDDTELGGYGLGATVAIQAAMASNTTLDALHLGRQLLRIEQFSFNPVPSPTNLALAAAHTGHLRTICDKSVRSRLPLTLKTRFGGKGCNWYEAHIRFLIRTRATCLAERALSAGSRNSVVAWLCQRAPLWVVVHVCALLCGDPDWPDGA